ncbi:MAG: FAD-dependent monooxygenase [Alphaproteobacteria bacterium]|nr:FAD-dependent monooxygenase [Alphaproteobacteria bacterium]
MTSGQTDIVIVGGGIAGLSLAALLGQIGLNITLVEPHAPPPMEQIKPTGRTVALMNTSLNILKSTQVLERIGPFTNPMERMRIIDDSMQGAKPIHVEFEAEETGKPYFGLNIPNGILRAALFERVQALESVRIISASLVNYEAHETEIIAHFDDGTKIPAKLIIGADGRQSVVRTLAGIDARIQAYDQSAVTCLIAHSRSHENTSTEFHRPAGPLAFVPLPGNRSSVVWVEKTDRAEEIMRLKKSEFIQALAEQGGEILGEITLEAGPECWPLSSVQAKSLRGPRVVILAEAAHVMSPVTAQGLNLSLRDIAALSELIADAARLGLDIGASGILKNFEKRRSFDIATRVFGVDGMNRAVSTDRRVLKKLRRAGLKTVGFCSPLKTLAVEIGLAPQIDQGRLSRGESL